MRVYFSKNCPVCWDEFWFGHDVVLFDEKKKKQNRDEKIIWELEYQMHFADCRNQVFERAMADYAEFREYFNGIMNTPEKLEETSPLEFRTFINWVKAKREGRLNATSGHNG